MSSRLALACALLAGLAISPTALASPPADGTGTYRQLLCANPSTGEGLGIAGMPEGLTNPASIDTWQISTTEADCGAGEMTPARGIPMAVGQGGTYGQGTWSALLYRAPANVRIDGASIYRAEKAGGANDGFMGINQQGGDYTSLYSLPRNTADQGDWFAGNVAARGSFAWPFSPENAVSLTISPEADHWDVNATCDPNGNNNSSCTLAAGQWEYRIFGGEITLTALKDPQAANITGPLSGESPLRGAAAVTFSATDEGPGLAYVRTIVDGSPLQRQSIDTNDGRCVPVPGSDPYTWAYQVPCKTSVGGRTYSLNTALLPDGSHHVQLVIEDAAGNQSTVLDRTVQTSNAPASLSPPTILAAGQPSPGTGLSVAAGEWSAPSGAGSIRYGYQWEDCDPQGNGCTAIAGAQQANYTAAPGDVGHSLRAVVSATDSDGAAASTSAPSAVVTAASGALLGLGGGGFTAPVGGSPNGVGASEDARLSVNGPSRLSRPFRARALKLTGRLSSGAGAPISTATLDLLEQIPGGSASLLGHALTRADGSFTVQVPPGPSRTVTLAYRAYSNSGGYAAEPALSENVQAGVTLGAAPRRCSPDGTITLAGGVSGPVPHAGVVVEMLVHYRGRWEPFRDPRTDAHGHFLVRYQFQGAVGRFPFRAQVLGGQSGFPYDTGASSPVEVTTG